MINSESIEISYHVLESLSPPSVVVVLHLVPVVRREAPILASCTKCIGWRASTCVHVEQRRAFPRINRYLIDSNWDIADENNSL